MTITTEVPTTKVASTPYRRQKGFLITSIAIGSASLLFHHPTVSAFPVGRPIALCHHTSVQDTITPTSLRSRSDDDDDVFSSRRRGRRADTRTRFFEEEYYYDNDDETKDEYEYGFQTGGPISRYNGDEYEYEDDDGDLFYDDEYDVEDDEENDSLVGNFWSNPSQTQDSTVVSESKQRRKRKSRSANGRYRLRSDSRDSGNESKRKSRRTSYKAGEPEAPPPLRDLYDRLFWYGFDPEDTGGVGDKTVFGGTKGKFNGLAYLDDANKVSPVRTSRGKRRPRSRSVRSYYEDDIDEDEEDYQDEYRNILSPPSDFPLPKPESGTSSRSRSSRRRQRRTMRDVEDDFEDSIRNQDVRSWFSEYEMENEEFGDSNSPRRKNTRNRRGSDGDEASWSPLNALDIFLGVNRRELQQKAGAYNDNMGLQSQRSRPRSKRRTGTTRRRPGYAYRVTTDDEIYDDDDEVMDTTIKDVKTPNARSSDQTTGSNVDTTISTSKEKTWEERAAAIARVPPSTVPGWGPGGELSVDARSQAISDALEDVQSARRKLELRKKKETSAKEAISILKV